MYKKYLLSVFVLFIAFAVIAPNTASAFWPFDYFKQDNVQKGEALTGAVVKTSDEQGITVCQLVELFISLGIIPSDKATQARQAVSNSCSTSSSSVSSNNGGGGGGGGNDSSSSSTSSTASKISVFPMNKGEKLVAGRIYDINWVLSCPISKSCDKPIRIELGIPGSDGSDIIITLASSQRYSWKVPSNIIPRNDYKIIIRDSVPPYAFLGSNDYFSIVSATTTQPSIVVTSPSTGSVFDNGTSQNIVAGWQSYAGDFDFYVVSVGNTILNVEKRISGPISRYSNGFFTTAGVIKETISSMSGLSATGGYYYRVEAVKTSVAEGDRTIGDGKSATFSIVNDATTPSITVLSPNGGEKWQVGKTYPIKWTSLDSVSQYVRIAILKDDQIIDQLGAGGVDNTGNYFWTIPNIKGDNYKVKIYDIHNDSISDYSNAPFSIISASSTQNLPDLKVSDLKISPLVATVGQEILLTATLSNIGNVVANANYNVDLGYQGRASKSDQNICYSGIDLNFGEKCLIAMKVKYSSPVSSNKIRIMVDPGNYIKELNETNNTKSISFPIYDISISSSSSSSKSADITAETGKVESYSNGARVYGAISNPNKENVWYYFKYRKDSDPLTETKQTDSTSINSQSTGGAVIFLYNLLPNTKYVYQLYAYSYTSGKTVNGELKSFTTLSSSTLTLTDLSSVSSLIDNGTSAPATSSVAFRFTMNNHGTSDLYVSKNPSIFVATSSTSGSLGNLTLVSADATTLSGDSLNAYFIPSGSSRKFTLDGSFGKNGTAGTMEFKITKIYFDDDTMGLQEFNIDSGLEKLGVVETF